MREFTARRFPQQIHPPVTNLRHLNIQPPERRRAGQQSQHGTPRPGEDILQRYIVFVHSYRPCSGENAETSRPAQHISILLKMESEAVTGEKTAWQRVQNARHPKRPHTLDYVERKIGRA